MWGVFACCVCYNIDLIWCWYVWKRSCVSVQTLSKRKDQNAALDLQQHKNVSFTISVNIKEAVKLLWPSVLRLSESLLTPSAFMKLRLTECANTDAPQLNTLNHESFIHQTLNNEHRLSGRRAPWLILIIDQTHRTVTVQKSSWSQQEVGGERRSHKTWTHIWKKTNTFKSAESKQKLWCYYVRKTWNELTACDLCDEHVSKKLLHYVKHINTLMSPSMSAAPTADEKNGDTIKENKLLRPVALRNVRFT